MQKTVAAILILAFFGQTFSQGFYYIDYLIEKSEYSKNCVNKSRPQLHCNGKCQLMKKIQEAEKRQNPAPEMKLAKNEVTSSEDWYTKSIAAPLSNTKHYTCRQAGIPIDQPSSFFHPPGV